MPTAPNQLAVVQSIITAHPEINRMSDGPFAPNRGGITQLVAQQLGAPWGRKSKDGSDTNLSDDALCYRLSDGRFEIYDILSGGDGSATWGFAGTFRDGENGYFKPVLSAPPQPPPVPPIDYAAEIEELKRRVKALEDKPAPSPPDLSGYVKHGETVTVTGKVSAFGFSKTVTSTGVL